MRKFRLLNVFVIIFASSVLSTIITFYALRKQIVMQDLLFTSTSGLPLLLYLGIALSLISFVISCMLYFGLKASQQPIIKKLQWLIVGNYTHPIFSENVEPITLLSNYTDVVDEQLNTLSQRLRQLNDDLSIQQGGALTLAEKTEILVEERHRIARELHDSVSQQLFAAMMLLSATRQVAPQDNALLQKQLKLIDKAINDAQVEMRALLLHLRPISLEGKTLKQGIERLLNELESKINLTVTLQLEDVKLDTTVEDNLFRIIQELVSNILRHAKASSVELSMSETADFLQLRVVDNGIGYNVEQQTTGYGLLNIKERVAVIGGTLNIVSVLNQGTIVEIKIKK